MNLIRQKSAVFAVSAIVGTMVSTLAIGVAQAQVDPFAAARPAPRPAAQGAAAAPAMPYAAAPTAAAPTGRVGFTAVESAVGASYAAAQPKGFASTQQIALLPKSVSAFPLAPKVNNGKALGAKPRVVIPSYSLALIRQGGARASAMGAGSDLAQRATSISTVMVGADDAMGAKLADEALADLIKRFKDAGIEVVLPAERDANKDMPRIKPAGQAIKGQNGWSVYGAADAPLRVGSPLTEANAFGGAGSAIALTDVSYGLNAVVLQPFIALDYEQIGGSGNSKYTGSASAGAEVKFVVRSCGASFLYAQGYGKGSGPGGSIIGGGYASEEPFGVMFQVDNRSDDVGMQRAFAMAGLSNMYRQSLYYGVEVVPDRYVALARAAYQGLNTAIVNEAKKARGL